MATHTHTGGEAQDSDTDRSEQVDKTENGSEKGKGSDIQSKAIQQVTGRKLGDELVKKYGELFVQHSELSAQHDQLSTNFDFLKKQHLEVEKLQTETVHLLNAKSHQLEELQNELAIAKAQVSYLHWITLDNCVTVYAHHNRLPCTRRTLIMRGKTEKQCMTKCKRSRRSHQPLSTDWR